MPSSQRRAAHPLFHLGYTLPDDAEHLHQLLNRTQYVLLCGTASRAQTLTAELSETPPPNLCKSGRYTLLRPTPEILVAAHGIGCPSADTLLHELHLALRAAGAHRQYAMIRVGTCGSLGLAPGTLVVSTATVDALLRPTRRIVALGRETHVPAVLHPALGAALRASAARTMGSARVAAGTTVCADGFYLEQARGDGAFDGGNGEEQRAEWLREAHRKGIVNFEMESLAVAAFACRVDVPAAVACVALVDRLVGEMPTAPDEVLRELEATAVDAVIAFVRGCVSGEIEWQR